MIARSYWEADHAISVPVMKTHRWSDVTCSMKNLVGVTPLKPPYGTSYLRDRVHAAYAHAGSGGFENAGIAGCFTDICRWRKEAGKEDFAIIDCSIGIEGNGPMLTPEAPNVVDTKERSPMGKYFLLASNDLAAADATVVRVMGRDAKEVKQLVMASRLGIGEIEEVDIIGATLDQLRIPDFKWVEAPVPEWGVEESPLPSLPESSVLASSRIFQAGVVISTLGSAEKSSPGIAPISVASCLFSNFFIIRAGTPPTIVLAGTSLVTTAPAATTAPSWMVTPGKIIHRVPSHTPSLIVTGKA